VVERWRIKEIGWDDTTRDALKICVALGEKK